MGILCRVNNQKFISIPFDKFINQLKYKCQLEGINLVLTEESYTSKCSFLDNEELCKHDVYLGKRLKRGLFESSSGRLINADVNGSFNIMRKVLSQRERSFSKEKVVFNAFKADEIEGLAVNPFKITF